MGKFNFPIQIDLSNGTIKRSFEVCNSNETVCTDIDEYTKRVLTAISLLSEKQLFQFAFTRDKLSLSEFFVTSIPAKVFERE